MSDFVTLSVEEHRRLLESSRREDELEKSLPSLGAMAEEIQIVADTGFANGITLEYWPITEDHRMSGGKQ